MALDYQTGKFLEALDVKVSAALQALIKLEKRIERIESLLEEESDDEPEPAGNARRKAKHEDDEEVDVDARSSKDLD